MAEFIDDRIKTLFLGKRPYSRPTLSKKNLLVSQNSRALFTRSPYVRIYLCTYVHTYYIHTYVRICVHTIHTYIHMYVYSHGYGGYCCFFYVHPHPHPNEKAAFSKDNRNREIPTGLNLFIFFFFFFPTIDPLLYPRHGCCPRVISSSRPFCS